MNTISQQLKELTELRCTGAISEDEFSAAKAKIIAPPQSVPEEVVSIQFTKKEHKSEKAVASVIVMLAILIMVIGGSIRGTLGMIISLIGITGFCYGTFRYVRVRYKIWWDHE